MRRKSVPAKAPADQVMKAIRRATRWQFSAEEKIRIVLEGLRGEDMCRIARALLLAEKCSPGHRADRLALRLPLQ